MRLRSLLLAVTLVGGCTDSSSTAAQTAQVGGGTTPGDVVATVNGTPITGADVRKGLGADLAKLEEQMYQLKRRQIDQLIAAHLLEAEATRRGLTLDAFEQAEITAKVPEVGDDEVNDFVAANRARIRGDAAALGPQIREFLKTRKTEERRAAVVTGLRGAARVDVTLAGPAPFRATLDLEGAPIRGDASAPVTIVEFSDFHCPFCRSVQPTLTTLLNRYKGKVRLVYKHLPLDSLHPQARRVSEAAYCAGRQDKFWQFHDAVYADTSGDAGDAVLARFAQAAGLDQAAFTACLADGEARQAVARDATEGEGLGLTGTPGFFINGRELNGAQPLEAFVAVIDEELRGDRP